MHLTFKKMYSKENTNMEKKEEMFNIKEKKWENFSKSGTGNRRDIEGSGGDVVDDSNTGGSGGKDSVAGAVKEKGVGKGENIR